MAKLKGDPQLAFSYLVRTPHGSNVSSKGLSYAITEDLQKAIPRQFWFA